MTLSVDFPEDTRCQATSQVVQSQFRDTWHVLPVVTPEFLCQELWHVFEEMTIPRVIRVSTVADGNALSLS